MLSYEYTVLYPIYCQTGLHDSKKNNSCTALITVFSLSPLQSIPLTVTGFVESLNLSAASAVLCAVLESKEALKPDLTPGEKKRVSLTWMARTVTGSMAVLRQGAGLNVKGTMLYNKIGEFTTRP